jgi:hypothetical protein
MLAARQNDGFMAAFTPVIGSEAGKWRPIGWPATPVYDPDGYVGNLKPFLIKSASEFRTKGPNALTSAAYAKDFAEVKELGALTSTTRTADQTAAAVFWQFAPIALYNPVLRDLAARFKLNTVNEARLYANVNLAAEDAAVAGGNDKYHDSFWRPRAAIREAPTLTTVADPTWGRCSRRRRRRPSPPPRRSPTTVRRLGKHAVEDADRLLRPGRRVHGLRPFVSTPIPPLPELLAGAAGGHRRPRLGHPLPQLTGRVPGSVLVARCADRISTRPLNGEARAGFRSPPASSLAALAWQRPPRPPDWADALAEVDGGGRRRGARHQRARPPDRHGRIIAG